jgi:asparagine synthase (glutamine-hydrolysing)
MFGFGLWDGRTREMWLVRDRRGIKPVYWCTHGGRLTFASEIKALLEVPGQPREIDHQALYHYLSFVTTPAPQTLFRGIRKLPAGGLVRVTAGWRSASGTICSIT